MPLIITRAGLGYALVLSQQSATARDSIGKAKDPRWVKRGSDQDDGVKRLGPRGLTAVVELTKFARAPGPGSARPGCRTAKRDQRSGGGENPLCPSGCLLLWVAFSARRLHPLRSVTASRGTRIRKA